MPPPPFFSFFFKNQTTMKREIGKCHMQSANHFLMFVQQLFVSYMLQTCDVSNLNLAACHFRGPFVKSFRLKLVFQISYIVIITDI